MVVKELKEFTLMAIFIFKAVMECIARGVSKGEGNEELLRVHDFPVEIKI